jgi:hypothetical protein
LNAALKKYITMFATQPSYIGLSSNVEIGLSEEPISFFEKYSEKMGLIQDDCSNIPIQMQARWKVISKLVV